MEYEHAIWLTRIEQKIDYLIQKNEEKKTNKQKKTTEKEENEEDNETVRLKPNKKLAVRNE